jgi:hypothetical protein
MQKYMYEYEEYKTLPPFWGWIALIIFSISIFAFGMIAHMIIPEREREWDHGALPIAPGEERYNTHEPAGPPSQQIHPLPEAYPLLKLHPDTAHPFSGECQQ